MPKLVNTQKIWSVLLGDAKPNVYLNASTSNHAKDIPVSVYSHWGPEGAMAFFAEGVPNIAFSPKDKAFHVRIKYHGFEADSYFKSVESCNPFEFAAALRLLMIAPQHYPEQCNTWVEQLTLSQASKKATKCKGAHGLQWLLSVQEEVSVLTAPGWGDLPGDRLQEYLAALHHVVKQAGQHAQQLTYDSVWSAIQEMTNWQPNDEQSVMAAVDVLPIRPSKTPAGPSRDSHQAVHDGSDDANANASADELTFSTSTLSCDPPPTAAVKSANKKHKLVSINQTTSNKRRRVGNAAAGTRKSVGANGILSKQQQQQQQQPALAKLADKHSRQEQQQQHKEAASEAQLPFHSPRKVTEQQIVAVKQLQALSIKKSQMKKHQQPGCKSCTTGGSATTATTVVPQAPSHPVNRVATGASCANGRASLLDPPLVLTSVVGSTVKEGQQYENTPVLAANQSVNPAPAVGHKRPAAFQPLHVACPSVSEPTTVNCQPAVAPPNNQTHKVQRNDKGSNAKAFQRLQQQQGLGRGPGKQMHIHRMYKQRKLKEAGAQEQGATPTHVAKAGDKKQPGQPHITTGHLQVQPGTQQPKLSSVPCRAGTADDVTSTLPASSSSSGVKRQRLVLKIKKPQRQQQAAVPSVHVSNAECSHQQPAEQHVQGACDVQTDHKQQTPQQATACKQPQHVIGAQQAAAEWPVSVGVMHTSCIPCDPPHTGPLEQQHQDPQQHTASQPPQQQADPQPHVQECINHAAVHQLEQHQPQHSSPMCSPKKNQGTCQVAGESNAFEARPVLGPIAHNSSPASGLDATELAATLLDQHAGVIAATIATEGRQQTCVSLQCTSLHAGEEEVQMMGCRPPAEAVLPSAAEAQPTQPQPAPPPPPTVDSTSVSTAGNQASAVAPPASPSNHLQHETTATLKAEAMDKHKALVENAGLYQSGVQSTGSNAQTTMSAGAPRNHSSSPSDNQSLSASCRQATALECIAQHDDQHTLLTRHQVACTTVPVPAGHDGAQVQDIASNAVEGVAPPPAPPAAAAAACEHVHGLCCDTITTAVRAAVTEALGRADCVAFDDHPLTCSDLAAAAATGSDCQPWSALEALPLVSACHSSGAADTIRVPVLQDTPATMGTTPDRPSLQLGNMLDLGVSLSLTPEQMTTHSASAGAVAVLDTAPAQLRPSVHSHSHADDDSQHDHENRQYDGNQRDDNNIATGWDRVSPQHHPSQRSWGSGCTAVSSTPTSASMEKAPGVGQCGLTSPTSKLAAGVHLQSRDMEACETSPAATEHVQNDEGMQDGVAMQQACTVPQTETGALEEEQIGAVTDNFSDAGNSTAVFGAAVAQTATAHCSTPEAGTEHPTEDAGNHSYAVQANTDNGLCADAGNHMDPLGASTVHDQPPLCIDTGVELSLPGTSPAATAAAIAASDCAADVATAHPEHAQLFQYISDFVHQVQSGARSQQMEAALVYLLPQLAGDGVLKDAVAAVLGVTMPISSQDSTGTCRDSADSTQIPYTAAGNAAPERDQNKKVPETPSKTKACNGLTCAEDAPLGRLGCCQVESGATMDVNEPTNPESPSPHEDDMLTDMLMAALLDMMPAALPDLGLQHSIMCELQQGFAAGGWAAQMVVDAVMDSLSAAGNRQQQQQQQWQQLQSQQQQQQQQHQKLPDAVNAGHHQTAHGNCNMGKAGGSPQVSSEQDTVAVAGGQQQQSASAQPSDPKAVEQHASTGDTGHSTACEHPLGRTEVSDFRQAVSEQVKQILTEQLPLLFESSEGQVVVADAVHSYLAHCLHCGPAACTAGQQSAGDTQKADVQPINLVQEIAAVLTDELHELVVQQAAHVVSQYMIEIGQKVNQMLNCMAKGKH
eukprot:jgi/Chrzof1/2257/Cz11g08210.t1